MVCILKWYKYHLYYFSGIFGFYSLLVPTLPRGNACSLHLEVFVNHPVRLRLPPLYRGEFFFFVGTPAGWQNAVYNGSL